MRERSTTTGVSLLVILAAVLSGLALFAANMPEWLWIVAALVAVLAVAWLLSDLRRAPLWLFAVAFLVLGLILGTFA